MLDTAMKIFFGILGLSIVVLVHEAGHYIAARITKIRVETFSIGFGKRIFGFRYGDTDYRISLIPLGGYCRFSGEESLRRALDERLDVIPAQKGEFYASLPWQRFIVSIAGPMANMIFSILVFTIIFWVGFQEQYTEPRIVLISDYSDNKKWPADEAGLISGDIIVEVDGKNIDRFNELRQQLIFRPGEEIPLTIMRNGKRIASRITPWLDKENGRALIGVMNWINPIIAEVEPESWASEAGLQPGDRIVAIGDTSVAHTVDVYNALEESDGILNVDIIRGGTNLTTQLRKNPSDNNLAISFVIPTEKSENLSFFFALARGVSKTWSIITSTLHGIRMMFIGMPLQNAVSGPIRLISLTGTTMVKGFQTGLSPGIFMSLELISLISISLGFLNLLPIPVLDGGQMILFLTEWIRRRPVKPRSIFKYQFIGTIIIIFIIIVATTGDLMHYQSR